MKTKTFTSYVFFLCLFLRAIFVFASVVTIPSQSHAFINAVSLDRIQKEFDPDILDSKKELLKHILDVETEYKDHHYVLYHAQLGSMFYQDLIKELIQASANQTLDPDFYFLRLPGQQIYQLQGKDDFFKIVKKTDLPLFTVDDEKIDIRKVLLSVNLSLYSNFDNDECSTLAFWLLGARSFQPPCMNTLLEEVLEYFDIDTKHLSELLEIYAPVKDFDNTMLQIFVPKSSSICDEILYFSHDRGVPCDHLEPDQTPSKLLSDYQTDITSIAHFISLQARLVITNSHILNPESGIKMKRYHKIYDQLKMQTYKKNLRCWVQNHKKLRP